MGKKLPSIKKHSIIAVSLFVVDAFILNQGIFSALILGVSLISLMIMLVMLIFNKERDLLKRRIVIAVIYVIMALMVQGSNALNNRIAMKRAGTIITACENYKGEHGAYPSKLSDLVPEFINEIPAAKYTLIRSDFRYSAWGDKHDLMFVRLPPFGRPIYHFEAKKWGYLD